MLDLDQVRSFVVVATHGSFHEAARRLGLAQPTVSQHIRKLEEKLGVALVARSNAGCKPSQKGAAFLPHARRLLRAAEAAAASVQAERVVVGAASNIGVYLLPAALSRFRRRFGDAPVLDVTIGANPIVIERLVAGDIDLALTEWWTPAEGFEAEVWRREPLVVIVAPDHPWAALDAVPVEWLADEPLIGGEGGTGTGRILQQALGPELMRRMPAGASLGSTEAVKRAVMAGLGVSVVLAGAVEDEAASGRLVARPIAGAVLEKPLWMVSAGSLPPAGAASLRDFLREDACGVTPLLSADGK